MPPCCVRVKLTQTVGSSATLFLTWTPLAKSKIFPAVTVYAGADKQATHDWTMSLVALYVLGIQLGFPSTRVLKGSDCVAEVGEKGDHPTQSADDRPEPNIQANRTRF